MPRAKLSEIMDGLEAVGDETRAVLDKQTGKVLFLMDEHLRAAEDDEDFADFGEWERESIEQAKAVPAEDGGRFLALPDRFEINDWDMMRDFAVSLDSEEQGQALLDAIHGRGAFRYFKDRIHEFALADAWYKFREAQYRQIALSWCEANGIEPDDEA